jgi:hypothetical protein
VQIAAMHRQCSLSGRCHRTRLIGPKGLAGRTATLLPRMENDSLDLVGCVGDGSAVCLAWLAKGKLAVSVSTAPIRLSDLCSGAGWHVLRF